MRRLSGVSVVAAVLMLALGVGLSGCSKQGDLTCQQFAALSQTKQETAVASMIQEHGLDPYSNAVGWASVQRDVQRYCGMTGLGLLGKSDPATKNLSSPIQNAVNWASYSKK